MADRIIKVGVIGCGEVAQTVHTPTLGFLNDRFVITYLCDVSHQALDFCARRVVGPPPATARDAAALCASPDVDVVFVINSSEYHAEHAMLALRHGKHVFLEKPAALNFRDIHSMQAAEAASAGKVMVGYMRRYAGAFVEAVKEVGGLDKILYARVRDIIGPNSAFVSQSGTFPQRFADLRPEDVEDLKQRRLEVVGQGLAEHGLKPTEDLSRLWNVLGGLGSHDISAMREVLGMPIAIDGASKNLPFWNVLFKYPGFTVSYESGIDDVPRFDAHIEVYSARKTVRVQFDTPYVKGLPVTMQTAEKAEDGALKTSVVRTTYEDPYTREMKALYDWYVHGTPVKTTIEDAEKDLKIFGMMMGSNLVR